MALEQARKLGKMALRESEVERIAAAMQDYAAKKVQQPGLGLVIASPEFWGGMNLLHSHPGLLRKTIMVLLQSKHTPCSADFLEFLPDPPATKDPGYSPKNKTATDPPEM